MVRSSSSDESRRRVAGEIENARSRVRSSRAPAHGARIALKAIRLAATRASVTSWPAIRWRLEGLVAPSGRPGSRLACEGSAVMVSGPAPGAHGENTRHQEERGERGVVDQIAQVDHAARDALK